MKRRKKTIVQLQYTIITTPATGGRGRKTANNSWKDNGIVDSDADVSIEVIPINDIAGGME